MRVLIADKLVGFVADEVRAFASSVEVEPGLSGAALTERLAAFDPAALVVRSTRVKAADIAASRALSLIVRAGAGVDTIDVEAAAARGVFVANCPGMNAAAVAELTLGHLVNLDRRIADNVAQLRAGQWNKGELGVAHGLRGRRLAVLGLGTIGREVARLGIALGMRVVGWSRSLDDDRAAALGIARAATPEDAARGAYAVTVHLAATPDTVGRIGASVFEAMVPGGLFINTSRAEVVDEAALLAAVAGKGIRAGLDVFAGEPAGKTGAVDAPLAKSHGVYGTHHIGASTAQAEEAVGAEVVRILRAHALGLDVPNVVNLARHTPATHVLVVRHADEVGVLAGVLGTLREGGYNVQEMRNLVFSGAHAACARIAIVGEPDAATLERLAAPSNVFSVEVGVVEHSGAGRETRDSKSA